MSGAKFQVNDPWEVQFWPGQPSADLPPSHTITAVVGRVEAQV